MYEICIMIMFKEVVNVNERIKKIRKTLGLSQRDFGSRLGISDTAVSKLEKGDRNPSEQTIKSICREFNVDYFWLTEGIGNEMFIKKETDPIKLIAKQHGLTDLEAEIVVEFMKLTSDERAMMVNIIRKLSKDK